MTEFEARLVKNKLSVQLKYLNDFFFYFDEQCFVVWTLEYFFRKKEGEIIRL